MMNTQNGYTPEQIKQAECLAQILGGVQKDKQNMLATMANAFFAGIEVGMQMKTEVKS